MKTLLLKNLAKSLSDEGIEIFIKDPGDEQNEYGYGFIYYNGEKFLAEQYQDRIDITEDVDLEKTMQELLENSKLYIADCFNLTDAVNVVLDFWFIKPINDEENVFIINDFSEIPKLMKDKGKESTGKRYVLVYKEQN